MARRKRYPSDLGDDEWELVRGFVEQRAGGRGRPAGIDRRGIVDAIFYVLRTGCQWRYLPEGFPHWNTVYGYFAKWRDDGTWTRLNDGLRRAVRVGLGRHPEPSAGIVDSQSAKTTEKGAIAASMAGS